MKKNHRELIITSAAALALGACGESPTHEVVTQFGTLTVAGAQYANGHIETTLSDEQDVRLSIQFFGRDTIAVDVGGRAETEEHGIDASALGSDLSAWNKYTYELWASLPESGLAETNDAVASSRRTRLGSGGGSTSGGSAPGGTTGGSGGGTPGSGSVNCQGTNCSGGSERDIESAFAAQCPGRRADCTYVNQGEEALDSNDDVYSCTCIQ